MADDGSNGETGVPVAIRTVTWIVLGVALMGILGLFAIRCELGPEAARAYPSRTLAAEPEPVLLPPPPIDEDYFPCMDCHAGEVPNRTRRELEDDHDDLELAHGDLWCHDCHTAGDYDRLHRADDTAVGFDESWRLCTQCHGKKLADWRAGVHGKRTGYWWGAKEYRSCVQCHDPHSPAWKPIEAKRPPKRPAEIRLDSDVRLEEVPHEAE